MVKIHEAIIIGFFTGFILSGLMTYWLPRGITAINKELLKAGLAYRDCETGMILWNDTKEK